MILSVNSGHDLVAYAAGCVVVLYNHKLDKQVGLLCSSTLKRPNLEVGSAGTGSHNLSNNNMLGAGQRGIASSLGGSPRTALNAQWMNNPLASPNINPLAGLMPMALSDPSIASSFGLSTPSSNKNIKPKPISCLSFSPDGQFLAIGEVVLRLLKALEFPYRFDKGGSMAHSSLLFNCFASIDRPPAPNPDLGSGFSIACGRTPGSQVWCSGHPVFSKLKASSFAGIPGTTKRMLGYGGVDERHAPRNESPTSSVLSTMFSMMDIFISGTGGLAFKLLATRSRQRSTHSPFPKTGPTSSLQVSGTSSSGT